MWYSTVSFASTSRSRTTEPTETTLVSTSSVSITRAFEQALLELGDLVLEHRLLVLRVVVLGVLGDVAELARDADAVGDLPTLVGSQQLELLRQVLVALGGEEHFLQDTASRVLRQGAGPVPGVTTVVKGSCRDATARKPHPSTMRACRSTSGKAGSSTRSRCRRGSSSRRWRASACRRSGGRDAGSAPGSSAPRWSRCAGIEHRNEKTLGYLRVASDEHPLAIQIFGSNPDTMAEAARMVEAAGADIVDINFGCPVRKVTKTGAGRDAARRPRRSPAASSRRSPTAVDLPVSVKMRRGLRERLARLPRASARGSSRRAPRCSRCTPLGAADVHRHRRPRAHGRARLARRRARDRLGRHHVARPGAGRARDDGRGRGHGRPRRAGQPVGAARDRRRRRRPSRRREEVVAELVLFIRETVRELGERRASGFLKKFYALVPRPGPLPAAVQAGARRARLDRGGRAAADRRRARARCR